MRKNYVVICANAIENYSKRLNLIKLPYEIHEKE